MLKMSEQLPSDAPARHKALDVTRSFIVQAPAGSGKTSLLTDRILALLARVDQPEQIVAMTFTRKAAAEMHARVMEKLSHGMGPAPDDDPLKYRAWQLARAVLDADAARGWDLLAHPARLRIQTIDSFCASLVRSMPWLTGLGGMPLIVENADTLYLQAARNTLEDAHVHEAVRELLIHLDLDVQAAARALADMLARRDQWLPLLGVNDQAADLEADLCSLMMQELSALSGALPLGWQEALAPPARHVVSALLEGGQSPERLLALQDWQAGDITANLSCLDQWQALADLLLIKETGQVRKSLNKNHGCPPGSMQKTVLQAWLKQHSLDDEPPEWARRLHAIRKMPSPQLSAAQWKILTAQRTCLYLAAAQLWVLFAERSEVDFIEVAQRAVQALGDSDDPSDLLLRLDQRLAHLLVDEFQDTSFTQLQLLEKLTSGWQAGDGRTLFLVGDPMQSIYRFRKAEVSLFLRVQQRGLGEVALENLQLSENFRSQAGMVQWVNETFTQLFPPQNDPDLGAIVYAPSKAWHPKLEQPAVQWHIQLDEAQAWDRVLQIAQQAWVQHAQSTSPLAILVRSRSHLGSVTRLLQAANLPCRAVELVRLAQRPVVIDLVQLLRAMLHRGDRAAWMAVLRAPWCGLTLGSLHTLFGSRTDRAISDQVAAYVAQPERPQAIDADQWRRLLGAGQHLIRAIENDAVWPLAMRFEQAWRALEGHRLVDEQGAQDAEALFRLVEKMAGHDHLDLDALEVRLSALYAEPSAPARAIDVMTMHKAKGLEFESVILLGLHRGAPRDNPPLVRVELSGERVVFGPVKASADEEQDPLARYLGQRESMRMDYEIDRLLYVAATRARQSLHIVAQGKIDKKQLTWADPSKGSLLRRLWRVRPQLALPEVEQEVIEQAAQPQWRGPQLLRRAEPSRAPQLTSQAIRPDRFAWPVQETAERLSGILIHAWLADFAASNRVTHDLQVPELVVLERQLQALGMPQALRPDAATQVVHALAAMLSNERGRWLLSQPLRRVEWALMDAQQTISIMDLAIDTPEGWLVVDYKNARRLAAESSVDFEQRMLSRYRTQLQRYVEQLQALDGRPAKAALYFPADDIWIEFHP